MNLVLLPAGRRCRYLDPGFTFQTRAFLFFIAVVVKNSFVGMIPNITLGEIHVSLTAPSEIDLS